MTPSRDRPSWKDRQNPPVRKSREIPQSRFRDKGLWCVAGRRALRTRIQNQKPLQPVDWRGVLSETQLRRHGRHNSRSKNNLEAPPGFEPGGGGFAIHCLTTWLRRRLDGKSLRRADRNRPVSLRRSNPARVRHLSDMNNRLIRQNRPSWDSKEYRQFTGPHSTPDCPQNHRLWQTFRVREFRMVAPSGQVVPTTLGCLLSR